MSRTLAIVASVLILALAGVLAWLEFAGDTDRPGVRVELPRPAPAAPAPKAPPRNAPKEPPNEAPAPGPTVTVPLPPKPEVPKPAAVPAKPVIVDPALLEKTERGALPRIGPDGRKPWQVYRGSNGAAAGKPRLAIVITDLGLKSALTEAAIRDLPPAVTLAFSPYADNLAGFAKTAREAGHELLLAVPMEPIGYPANDPGEMSLLTSLSETDNLARLRWSMGRFAGYVGVVPHMGGRFLASPEHLRPVLKEISGRGLVFLSPESGREAAVLSREIGLPVTVVTGAIDDDPSRGAVLAALDRLAAAAKTEGRAVALGRPYPATVEAISAWLKATGDKGVVAAPLTAVIEAEPAGR